MLLIVILDGTFGICRTDEYQQAYIFNVEERVSPTCYTSVVFAVVLMKTKSKKHYGEVAQVIGEHIRAVTQDAETSLEKIFLKTDW